jgi:hypothetical protein
MPMSGLLCESQFGWPMVFYIHALITAFLTAAWWIVYRDIPNRHPQISHAELRVIRRGKTPIASENQEKVRNMFRITFFMKTRLLLDTSLKSHYIKVPICPLAIQSKHRDKLYFFIFFILTKGNEIMYLCMSIQTETASLALLK